MPAQHSAAREPWRARLYIPNYQVQEAAQYARVSAQTVRYWHRVGSHNQSFLVPRESGEALSYMELIEVAVVPALRKLGLTLKRIKDARDYVSNSFKKEYPFAAYDFKTDGRSVLLDYQQVDKKKGKGKLLNATQKGQLSGRKLLVACFRV